MILKGSSFYRDNPKLVCMGHPDCRWPCKHERDRSILRAARAALTSGTLSHAELRCLELDIQGFPGKVIIGYAGQDPTGAMAKRAKYACEKAYAKIGRRLCLLCQMLWAADKPKGPRLNANLKLKYPKETWKTVRESQASGPLRVRRKHFSFSQRDNTTTGRS